MKRLAVVTLLMLALSSRASAQDSIDFNTAITDCVNRWVAYRSKPEENRFPYGFIYLDDASGFTFRHAGYFKITPEGRFEKLPEEKPVGLMLVRLQRGRAAGPLPKQATEQLGLPERPDWLKIYDDGANSIEHRVRQGYWYNDFDASDKALPPLESAYREKPQAGGLAFELGFAYNVLGRFDEAVQVLKAALKQDKRDPKLGSELAFSYLASGRIQEAATTYLEFLKYCSSDCERRAEMALNLAECYRRLNDEPSRRIWLRNAKQWAAEGSSTAEFFKTHPELLQDSGPPATPAGPQGDSPNLKSP